MYFLAALLAMAALHLVAPGKQLIGSPWRYAGIIDVLAGIALVLWAAGLFRRAGTPIKPFESSSELVLTGPYRFTRNPMYLGLTVILLGTGVLLGSATPFLVVPVFLLLLDRLFVRHEEAMLAGRFGEAYEAFRRRVRRWL